MKDLLRQRAKEIRKKLDTVDISAKLRFLIRQNELYKKSENVLLYYPKKYEMDFLELLGDNKNFYFPRVEGKEMLICPYSENAEFKKSVFGVYEPCSNPVPAEVIDLAIVPALAADEKGNRLGYGGGFYDRFLSKYKNIKTICALPESLVFEKIPAENHDIPVNILIKLF